MRKPLHALVGPGSRRTKVVLAAAVTAAVGGSAFFLVTANAAETPVAGRLQAEAYSAQSGAQTEGTTDTDGGRDVGWLASGDWLRYDNVTIGRALTARIASDNSAGGSVELHTGSPTGPLLATFPVAKTGGWQKWVTVSASISLPPTGPQSLVAVMKSAQKSDFVNINWFTLGAGTSATPVPTVSTTAPTAAPTTAPTSASPKPTTKAPTSAPTSTAPATAAPTTAAPAPGVLKKRVSALGSSTA